MIKFSKNSNRGFTLIEILVVIGIIAILAAIVIIAINPARQFAQARNTQRQSNINALLNAIGQNIADNKGIFTTNCPVASSIPTLPASTTIGTLAPSVNLEPCLVPTYIPSAMPTDPDGGTSANTLYTIGVDSLGRYSICAPKAVEVSLPGSTQICVIR